MLKNMFIFSGLLLSLWFVIGCEYNVISGSGHVTTVTREISDFHKIDLSGDGNMIITHGDTPELKIKADDNFLDYIKSDVVDGTLILAQQDKGKPVSLKSKEGITYYLTIKDLDHFSISGATKVSSENPLKGQQMTIDSHGASNITLPLEVEDLKVNLTGSGDLTLTGLAQNQDVNYSGSGTYKSFDLKSDHITIHVSGSGYLKVFAEKTLDVTINGSGSVKYIGSPKVTLNINGSGSVQKI